MKLRIVLVNSLILAAALLLQGAGVVEEKFKEFDKNEDGAVTTEEALSVIGERLPRQYLAESDSPPITTPVEIQEGPQIVKASEAGVGRMAPDISLKKLDGSSLKLGPAKDGKALVLGFFSPTCPMSGKLGPEMARLEKDYMAKGVSFIWLSAPPASNLPDITKFVKSYQLGATIGSDADGAVAKALHATTTTEVFVFDAGRTLTYRGAINDQYGLGYALDYPRHTYLRNALDAVLLGNTPDIAATTAPGCALDLAAQEKNVTNTATYHRDIARLLNQNCIECHRPDGLAPFSLTSYDDVIEHAGMIRKQVERGAMPP